MGTVGFVITSVIFDRSIRTVIGLTLLSVCTTFVDATGLVIYFLIAKAVLHI